MLAQVTHKVIGRSDPRIAPPVPARSTVDVLDATASGIGMTLLPWQRTVGTYLEARNADDTWLYPEVAVIVARQQGKTEILLPHVKRRLEMGRRVLHMAQTRDLPRRLFRRLEVEMVKDHPKAIVRRSTGMEAIEMPNGGHYSIAAATGGGARGTSVDDLLLDELREIDEDAVGAAMPTVSASLNPQVVYLSNAGHDDSKVLNSVRDRAGRDPSLAYLEWSADPDRQIDDVEGWAEANPSLSYFPALHGVLERAYRSAVLSGQLAIFETEHLCRWVSTMRPRLVDDFAWHHCRTGRLDPVTRPSVGISMDPAGNRASVVIAWQQADRSIALRELFDVPVDESGIRELGEDALKATRRYGSVTVGYDDWTDRDLARHWKKKAKAIVGKDFANASEAFARAVASGYVHWTEAPHITDDLLMTSRKDNSEPGTFHAVKSKEDVPITASLAAIRAFWLASASTPSGQLRVY